MPNADLFPSAQGTWTANVLDIHCPSRAILQHVTSCWGTLVLIALSEGTLRFSQVRRRVEGISERMLARTLQVLEADHLVRRQAHDVVPPRVDYTLTPMGCEVTQRVRSLACWIEDNLPALVGP